MSLFFIAAAVLVVAALLFIIPSALKSSNTEELDQLETNISIAKDRRAQLRASLESGALDQATHDSEVSDLEHTLANDITAADKQRDRSQGGLGVAAVIALFIPIASGALYLNLGQPNAVNTQAMNKQAMNEQAIAAQAQQADAPRAMKELLPNLERKLLENPGDVAGWKLLGTSYLTISDFSNAKRALERAYELDDQDPELLAQLAESTAMEQGGNLSGEASEYLASALSIDPNHQQSLWLTAISKQQAGEHEDAIARFQTLRAGVADNPSAVASINEMVNASRAALGLEPIAATATATAPPSTNANANANANNAAPEGAPKVMVTVTLDDAVADQVNPDDSVFIFATATTGPPMPLAVSRHTVADLPVTVELNDSMAMMPAMTLSQFPSVTVGARVSRSGNPIGQTGDWFGEAMNIEPAGAPEIALTIDTQQQ